MSPNVTSSSKSPFCCCWSRRTSASGRRSPILPSCILICSSHTLARLKCKVFARDWHATKAISDSFDWSPFHQLNACVSGFESQPTQFCFSSVYLPKPLIEPFGERSRLSDNGAAMMPPTLFVALFVGDFGRPDHSDPVCGTLVHLSHLF